MKISTLALSIGMAAMGAGFANAAEPTTEAVLKNYADIALAGYEDALTTAKALDAATDALIANASEDTLAAARAAWKSHR